MSTRLQATLALGQHLWLDNLSRELMRSGDLARWIRDGVQGITTNPAIFHKAITGGEGYREDLARLRASGLPAEARYEALAVADVQRACDAMVELHASSGGDSGWVSLEVSPHLANDAVATAEAAVRLNGAVGRPNLLVKIPATTSGLQALTTVTGQGINVNMTLIFSLSQAVATAKAWAEGARLWLERGGAPGHLYSVASVFLSRVDAAVDPLLQEAGSADALALRGRTAIAVAKLCHQRYLDLFDPQRHPAPFADLIRAGVRPQRCLWASTGTKNPDYPDTLYVDELIGAGTVNTVPEATLRAFADHGTVVQTLTTGIPAAEATLIGLKHIGIDLPAIGERLQGDGLTAFVQAYDQILASV